MTITAKIIADSLSPAGIRLTTFVIRYPRFIHSEVNTHRMVSKSASSSRAIPVDKMIQQIIDDPAMPVFWGKNQPGMQASTELDETKKINAQIKWLAARDFAVRTAKDMVELGLHKQIANRILEPWMHITVVASATEWTNFFGLRLHKDAQPEFQELARKMAKCYLKNIPENLQIGQWHMPFVREDEKKQFPISDLIKFSVARCARVSYLNHDGTVPKPDKDIELHDRLLAQTPKHSSPAEAVAMAHAGVRYEGNFRGFIQYRKTLPQENITTFPWEQDQELLDQLLEEITQEKLRSCQN